MEVGQYLNMVIELAVIQSFYNVSGTDRFPRQEDCSRLCMKNETCFRFMSFPEREKSRRYSGQSAMHKTKRNSCLDRPGFKPYGPGLCLKYVSNRKSWTAAAKICLAHGASLFQIDDKKKNLFLKRSYARRGCFWVGGNDKSVEGTWEWADGTLVVGFLDWLETEPDGDYIQNCMMACRQGWASSSCARTRPFLCEMREV